MEELSLLQQGYYLLAEKNFNAAREIFLQLLTEKETPDAYIGLLLAANSMRGEEQLTELPEPLSSYEEYRKALACADEGGKARLVETAEKQKPILEKKKGKYELLCAAAPDGIDDPAKADELIALALSLGNYKDAPAIKEALEKRKDELEQASKKKKNKRMAVILPLCILAAAALIVAGFFFAMPKKDGVRYALWFGGYTAISCDSDKTQIVLEEKINGIKVTAIGREAFKDCENLESITLGVYVEQIGRSAFNDCKKLSVVIGSEHVNRVEEKAFKSCKKLRLICFAEDCSIDPEAFKGCSKDLKVLVGNGEWIPPEEPDEP